MENQLRVIEADEGSLHYLEEAINLTISTLGKLRAFLANYSFENKIEEISFFRESKPQLTSRLIFFNELYNIESGCPISSTKVQKKYYQSELNKLNAYFDENLEFYKYYRTENRCLDHKYFLRGCHDIKLTLDSHYYDADHQFSTSHDYKVARILAHTSIGKYIEDKLSKLDGKNHTPYPAHHLQPQKWTASKVSLTELIYALHSEGVFNNGASELKDIVTFFENAFQIDLGQFHRTFLDIRSRTSERSRFLNTLKDRLNLRMDNADD